jgi:hypothetical protein
MNASQAAIDPIAILKQVRIFLDGSDRVRGIDPIDLDSDVCRLIDHFQHDWVTVPCTSPTCRNRRNGFSQGFPTTVRRGEESHAQCNECFGR